MTPAEIRAAIAADPALQALVPDTVALAAALSSGRVRTRFVLATERTAVAALGIVAGETFLQALDDFAAATLDPLDPLLAYQPGIRRQIGWIKRDGLDLGAAATRDMMDALAAAGRLDPAAVATMKALGEEPAPVVEYDVRRAIFNADGSLAA